MKFSIMDIGTNTVLCLIAEKRKSAASKTELHVIKDLAQITRLGQGLNQTACLHPDAMKRTLEALTNFAKESRQAGVPPENIFLLATAGMRRAQNAVDFVEEVKNTLGLEMKIIDGLREAQLSYLGVRHGLQDRLPLGQPLCIMDIGGGSTELIEAKEEIGFSISLPLGSVWLTEKFLQESDPPHLTAYQAMGQEIDKILSKSDFPWHSHCTVVGIAGTVTTLAAIAQRLKTYDPEKVHGAILKRKSIEDLMETFLSLPLAERKNLPGLEAKRADVIIAGSAICLKVLEHCQAQELWVCDQGLRYGAAYEMVRSHTKSSH